MSQPLPERRTIAYCHWHNGLADTVRLICVPADQGSIRGAPGLFACAPCRVKHRLTPIGDQA